MRSLGRANKEIVFVTRILVLYVAKEQPYHCTRARPRKINSMLILNFLTTIFKSLIDLSREHRAQRQFKFLPSFVFVIQIQFTFKLYRCQEVDSPSVIESTQFL